MTKQKQDCRNFCTFIKKDKLKHHIDISIQTLYSVLSWSSFGSEYSLESSWVWRNKLSTPEFEDFLPFFSTDLLKLYRLDVDCQWIAIFRSAEIFNWVQFKALAGPLKDSP